MTAHAVPSEGNHIGRSFHGHPLEDECPCKKAPCGLVAASATNPECLQHPWQRTKTIRQSHPASACPGAVAVPLPAPIPLPVVTEVCPVCEAPATWAIQLGKRSCTSHLGDILAQLYRDEPHPFAPFLAIPLRRGKW